MSGAAWLFTIWFVLSVPAALLTGRWVDRRDWP